VFGLSLFSADNAEQVFMHYDKKDETEFFLKKVWGLFPWGCRSGQAAASIIATVGQRGQ